MTTATKTATLHTVRRCRRCNATLVGEALAVPIENADERLCLQVARRYVAMLRSLEPVLSQESTAALIREANLGVHQCANDTWGVTEFVGVTRDAPTANGLLVHAASGSACQARDRLRAIVAEHVCSEHERGCTCPVCAEVYSRRQL